MIHVSFHVLVEGGQHVAIRVHRESAHSKQALDLYQQVT